MTELITQGSQALTAVPDVAEDVQLVALNQEEMLSAQSRLAAWFEAKEGICRRDHAEAEQELAIADRNGWKLSTFKAQTRRLLRRALFYEKCKLAAQAGYAVIPNMPATAFAIRTTRKNPNRDVGDRSQGRRQESNAPPAGDGEWRNPDPLVQSWGEQRENYGREGTHTVRVFENYAFDDEIEFPVSIAKPVMMTATQEAMAGKFFDELHVLPEPRAKGDPLLLGVIRRKDRHYNRWESNDRLTFLIGWYIDTREL